MQTNPQLSNVARTVSLIFYLYSKYNYVLLQAAVQAGLSDDIPCHTINMNCLSSNAAINTG